MHATGLSHYLPTQIGGMLGACGVLVGCSLVAPAQAVALHSALMPGVAWIMRWLPVFLVPVQVMLPTIEFPGGAPEGITHCTFLALGWLATLLATARICKAFITLLPAAPEAASAAATTAVAAPQKTWLLPTAWLAAAAALFPFGLQNIALDPAQVEALPSFLAPFAKELDRTARSGCLLALGAGSFAASVLWGFPGHIAMLLCGVGTIGGAAAMAVALDESYSTVVNRDYLTRSMAAPGSGDILLWFLGPALVATGVQMFQYRSRVQTLGPALLGTTFIMSLANILGTVAVAPMLGISPELSLASTVRCVTVPMALPTYARLCEVSGMEGNVAFVALSAGITGFIGFAFSRGILASSLAGGLTAAQPAPRGIATGVAAHVLGAATFAAAEPEALAWGMLGMAFSGVLSSMWVCSCPPLCDLVIRLAKGEVFGSSPRALTGQESAVLERPAAVAAR